MFAAVRDCGIRWAAVVCLAVVGVGCGPRGNSTGDDAGDCVPGRVQTCSCADGSSATRVCSDDGTFGACRCGDVGGRADAGEVGDTGPMHDGSVRRDGADGGDTSEKPSVELPIRVIPADGRSEYVESVEVRVGDPSGVESLFLQGHSLDYEFSVRAEGNSIDWGDNSDDRYGKKASVRLNGGSWVDISNENVDCLHPADEYGCVGGAFHTLRLTIPIEKLGSVRKGRNTIEFRFNGTNGTSSGYRILKLGLRNADGDDAIDGTRFEYEDYSEWEPPEGYDNPSAIAAGERLWHKREILVDGGATGDPSNPEKIVGACSSCHATNGRDLKYFNYSNRSIIARSRFHSLSTKQGKQIAAYIRSIDLDLPDGYTVDDTGTPWDPPYQPGRGLDDKPVELWAAGAGLEAVLEDDIDAKPVAEEILKSGRYKTGRTINIREFPIAMQLPDWNNWLPDIAPEDLYGKSFVDNKHYEKLVEKLPGKLDSKQTRKKLIQDTDPCGRWVGGIYGEVHDAFINYSEWPEPKTPDNPVEDYLGRIANHQFVAVKLWHLHTEYDLQDLGREVYRPGTCSDQTFLADRQWMGEGMQVFRVAPHMNSRPAYPKKGPYPTDFQNVYFSSAWYELQLILNVGARGRRAAAGNPMDWNYHHPHVDGSTPDGHPQYLRFWRGYVYQMQARDGLPDPRLQPGINDRFKFRHLLPGGGTSGIVSRQYFGMPAGGAKIDAKFRRRLIEAGVEAFMDQVERYKPSAWPRCSSGWCQDDAKLADSTYEPKPKYSQYRYADSFRALVPELERRGVSPALVDRVARRAEAWWPKGDWEQWFN